MSKSTMTEQEQVLKSLSHARLFLNIFTSVVTFIVVAGLAYWFDGYIMSSLAPELKTMPTWNILAIRITVYFTMIFTWFIHTVRYWLRVVKN